MPVVIDGAVLWKEADPGFAMFNWGRMFHHDLETGTTRRLRVAPQQFVNYPSAGNRFAAWWGADSFQLGVYDLVLDEPQLLFRNSTASQESALRPHIAGDLLVWMHVDVDAGTERGELRYAFLPTPRRSMTGHGRVMRITSSASSSWASVIRPSATWPRSMTTWRIVLRSASACLAMLAASS